MSGLLLLLFWGWVIILGFKGVYRRMSQLNRWLRTPWGSNDDLMPTLRHVTNEAALQPAVYHERPVDAVVRPTVGPDDVTRNMRRALEEERRTADQLSKDIADWQHAIGELRAASEGWTDKAATALAKGRNDLARAAIAERQRAEDRATELEHDVAEMRTLLDSHSSDIQNLETQLGAIYRRHHMAETRLQAAENSKRTRHLLYGEQVRDAMTRFDALDRAADEAEGDAEALSLGAPSPLPSVSPLIIDRELDKLRAGGFGRKGVTP